MTKAEALRTALENLLQATRHLGVCPGTVAAAEAALAQQEPVYKVTVVDDQNLDGIPLSQWGEPLTQKPPTNCGSGHCSCIECWNKAAKHSRRATGT